jgi:hypothetical protein
MWERCTNAKSKAYRYYGAKGVTVTNRWRHFERFLTDMGTVIHLLRRAAALESYEEGAHGNFLRSAAIQLSAPWEIEELARLACCYVCNGDGTSRSIQLKAAARVESRAWPPRGWSR